MNHLAEDVRYNGVLYRQIGEIEQLPVQLEHEVVWNLNVNVQIKILCQN